MASTDSKQSSRKRLVPLLEARLNDQTISELAWIDKEKKIFRMPWRHHKSAKWGGPEAFMLRELAKVMYNYSGPDIPTKRDLSEWKGLLRNNLKTLCDFEELHPMHVLESNNPYKVYRFVSNGEKLSNRRKDKVVGEFQGQGNNCRRTNVQERAYQENIPSVVSSYTNGSNSHFTTLSYQDDEQDIIEELFPNTGMAVHETKQFDLDELSDALGRGPNESSEHCNSSSENVPYVNNGLDFLDDSPSQAILSMSDVGDNTRDDVADENVNIYSSPRSAYQQRTPYVASSNSSGIDGSVNSLLQPVDQDEISREPFQNVSSSQGSAYQQRRQCVASSCSSGIDGSVNSLLSDQDELSRELFLDRSHLDYQIASQFDISALQCEGSALQFDVSALQFDGFDLEFSESKGQSNIFRSRSPLTTSIDPILAYSNSQTSSSCDTDLGNSTQRVSPNGLSQHLATRGVVYNNIPHVVASLSLGMNYATCASSTEASRDTSVASDLEETMVHSDLLTAVGTSTEMANNIDLSGFSHRTCLSLTKILSVHRQLGVQVRYYNCPSIQPRIMPGEFRICFVEDSDEREAIASFRNDVLTGPRNVHRLELPPAQTCTRLSKSQIKNTTIVLNNLKGGIVVSLKKGNIYATRYCRAGTLFSVSGQAEWQKLDRLIQKKIFDYSDYFSTNQVLNAQPFVRISFASRNPKKPVEILVLTMDIWHMEALLWARQVEENSSSLEPDLSLSNEFDRILSIGEMLMKSTPPTV